MSYLTDKQQQALEGAERRIEAITGTDLGEWHIAYRPESRPGRGHDLSAWACDGEYLATQYLDPYGHGDLVVSSMDLIHSDSDEEHFDEDGICECAGELK